MNGLKEFIVVVGMCAHLEYVIWIIVCPVLHLAELVLIFACTLCVCFAWSLVRACMHVFV